MSQPGQSELTGDQLGLEGCRVCHLPKEAHKADNILHEFMPQNGRATLVARDRQSQSSQASEGNRQGAIGTTSGGDPALRLTLIRAGVIRHEDLLAVEMELRELRSAGYEPKHAQPNE